MNFIPITYKNTNLNISLYKGNTTTESIPFNKIFKTVVEERSKIEKEIIKNPLFKYSLEPLKPDNDSPEIIKNMCYASNLANVGPMASVAGAIAEILCEKCIGLGFDAGFIENGGDIALFGDRNFKIQIYTKNSPFSDKFFIPLNPAKLFQDKILGICTSSSSIGPSVSFGDSDATTIIANSPAIADAFATSLGNLVKNDEKCLEDVIEFGKKFNVVKGICIIVKDKIGMWNVRLEKF
ncbi:MAG: UPF0280 family protein [Candidatus Altiarchaeum hamiconexum]|uniref:UPF0280 family protein n=1 Tax=Candidatus Altarchaeum hamiconexum TaxID=1803513 RepID=A0A8J7YTJ6_9ARCH|nr:UPF0280 family protein [Candidatus Altarchaeum hamiconexum]OIQ05878.1 MAG: hypothetical protein AUK59_02110 [Candidatus Altarchaeum sp. CG2_30_32_3053]PIV27896.1 MAG: hypothetical protein COS36_04155 [Candidatus Altarchaeum sp. CG03_land_8_20_14_0_80_32_618]PJC13720.1 MAG: hypothetical protein CO063_03765 [Candidatus Altarchaeum sp. CG_4_9_14_0_8_um_filter_32_206]NCS90897.1 UPF0280 family protein [Candidatus Altarchaeum hamiconexum]